MNTLNRKKSMSAYGPFRVLFLPVPSGSEKIVSGTKRRGLPLRSENLLTLQTYMNFPRSFPQKVLHHLHTHAHWHAIHGNWLGQNGKQHNFCPKDPTDGNNFICLHCFTSKSKYFITFNGTIVNSIQSALYHAVNQHLLRHPPGITKVSSGVDFITVFD